MILPKLNIKNPVEQILNGQLTPGIYRLRSELNADHIVAPLNKVGWRGFYIEGHVVTSKAAFLRMAGAGMSFPAYYGQNWDAFEECITDLSWVPAKGYVLIYDNVWYFPRNDRPAWRQAKAILTDAVSFWAQRGTPFYVFLRNAWWYAHDIPRV
jgi:hypothetical protein